MAKKNHLLAITVMLVGLLCSVLQNGLSFDAMVTAPVSVEGTIVQTQEWVAVYEVSRGYSNVTQQDYFTSSPTAGRVTAFKRSQNGYRNYQGQEVLTDVLEKVSGITSISFTMVLIAACYVGLSKPFQCLLYYIQDMDGKKKIA